MTAAEKLRNIIRIKKSGKKPMERMIFWPGLDDLYEFKGSKYTYEQLQKEIEDYECITGEPFILIWFEEKTYPETQQIIDEISNRHQQ
jgi:hypothetical protein